MFHDGNNKWRYKVKIILNLESENVDQLLISYVTLNETLKL